MKIAENKPLSAVIKIATVLTVNIFLRYFILPSGFWEIDTRDFIYKYLNGETLSVLQWFYMFWNRHIRQLTRHLFIIVIIILLLFRFRFKKAENFRLSYHTAIIASLCCFISAIGFSYTMYYDSLHDALMWQSRISDVLGHVFITALFEEFIYRGFITNELFRLKPSGLKTPAAIAISAAVFGFVHLQSAIILLLRGFTHSFMNLGAWEQFFFAASFGVSMAVILYYKKDIISLICIHAANNILSDLYISSGKSVLIGALYVLFLISFVICYPAVLIYKAWEKPECAGPPFQP
jgi:membrane protease YdiL (CAAX protease family)